MSLCETTTPADDVSGILEQASRSLSKDWQWQRSVQFTLYYFCLELPDTSYISIKSNILKYMPTLFQILSDCFPLFYKPYWQETTWKVQRQENIRGQSTNDDLFYKTWRFITSTSTRYLLNLNQEYYS